jgi:hypothetical protein
LKAPVSKTGIPATVSRVRISPCPLLEVQRRQSYREKHNDSSDNQAKDRRIRTGGRVV